MGEEDVQYMRKVGGGGREYRDRPRWKACPLLVRLTCARHGPLPCA